MALAAFEDREFIKDSVLSPLVGREECLFAFLYGESCGILTCLAVFLEYMCFRNL